MSEGRIGNLARVILRAWQLRFAVGALIVAVGGSVIASGIADALQATPTQRADAVMGSADFSMQLPGVARPGDASLRTQLVQAAAGAGAAGPVADYSTAGVRADGNDETTYAFEEFSDVSSVQSRFTVLEGRWPDGAGEVALAGRALTRWPVGSTVSFFNGELTATVVGAVGNSFDRASPLVVLGPGTWESLSASVGQVSENANVNLRWSGGASPEVVRDAVIARLTQVSSLLAQGDSVDAYEVQARQTIESRQPPINVTSVVAQYAVPLVAGLVVGLLAGGFTARLRTTMWTIGVPFARTRLAAYLAVIGAAIVGSLGGVTVGLILSVTGRPLLDLVSNSVLGEQVNVGGAFATVPFALAGSVLGLMTAQAHERRRWEAVQPSREGPIWLVTGAIVLAACGVAVGTGASEVSRMTVSSLLLAVAGVLVTVPLALAALKQFTRVSSFAARLALRRVVGGTHWGVTAIAGLQVVGCALGVFATSIVADINAGSESQAPPGQIAIEVGASARAEFEDALGLRSPVAYSTLAAGNERGDGATRAVRSPDDLERLVRSELAVDQRELLESGGILTTKPLNGATSVLFPSDGRFDEIALPAAHLDGIDASFNNISGFVLVDTADNAGIPLSGESYVYTDVTLEQQLEAKSVAQQLSMNPASVTVYRAPDELVAPLRISVITVSTSLVAAAVLLILATSQVRQLRPDLAGVRALGVGPNFLKRVVMMQVAVVVTLSSAVAISASAFAVGVGFAISDAAYTLTLPAIPTAAMFISFIAMASLVALVASKRLANEEWAETQ